eukprot:762759-Hanusia_phi.AAC.3
MAKHNISISAALLLLLLLLLSIVSVTWSALPPCCRWSLRQYFFYNPGVGVVRVCIDGPEYIGGFEADLLSAGWPQQPQLCQNSGPGPARGRAGLRDGAMSRTARPWHRPSDGHWLLSGPATWQRPSHDNSNWQHDDWARLSRGYRLAGGPAAGNRPGGISKSLF